MPTRLQNDLAHAFRKPEDLLAYLNVPIAAFESGFAARRLFPMRVPRPFAQRMRPGDADDPLLRQVLPRVEEFQTAEQFIADPLQEKHFSMLPGLLHKYKTRILLIFRGGCAINCRYCFRRHFPYADNVLQREHIQDVVDYIQHNPEVNEVISLVTP